MDIGPKWAEVKEVIRMKRRRKLLSILLSLALVVSMIPAFTVPATALEDMQNVHLSADGILTWDAVPGAKVYDLSIGGYTEELSADLNQVCRDGFMKRGDYSFTLEALSDYKWNSGRKVANSWEGVFHYAPPYSLSNPANLRWEGMVARWDPVPNAEQYRVYLYRQGLEQTVTIKNTASTYYDFSEIWDDYANPENMDKPHAFTVIATGNKYYEVSDKVSSGYQVVDYSGLTTELHRINVINGEADKSWAKKGETVTIRFTGSTDPLYAHVYGFLHWRVEEGKPELASMNDPETTLVMPGSDITVVGDTETKALFKRIFDGGQSCAPPSYKDKTNPFVDVTSSMSYYEPILWAYHTSPQVTNGMDATHFGPERTVTRGQCAAFLWRAMGEPEPKSTYNPFKDVPEWQYYYKPILWAVENGITLGTSADRFSPDLTLSTAHIITFLYRTLNPGKDGWYEEAANWASRGGKPFGVNLKVNNTTDCPRGAVASFLYECFGKLKNANMLYTTGDFYMWVDDVYEDSSGTTCVSGRVRSGTITDTKKISLRSYDENSKTATSIPLTIKSLKSYENRWKTVGSASAGALVEISFNENVTVKAGDVLLDGRNESGDLKTVKGIYVGTLEVNTKRRGPVTKDNRFQYVFGQNVVNASYLDLNGGDINPGETRTGVRLEAEVPVTWVVGQTLTFKGGAEVYGTFTITGVWVKE